MAAVKDRATASPIRGSRARASVSSPRTPEDRYRLITLEIKSLTRKAAPIRPREAVRRSRISRQSTQS